ncbi:MAG: DUF309 domain-containing protein [Chloroflexi bacterium]|nr:MAG: DUF309 domain-containing protein [Chloroflexota bacterium]
MVTGRTFTEARSRVRQSATLCGRLQARAIPVIPHFILLPLILRRMSAPHPLKDLDGETQEALAKGIAEFNSWRFYDCHETLEDVWREVGSKGGEGTLADFYQGVIKIAAGFHHLLRGNHKGAVNLLSDAFRLLESYRPVTLGIDVERLLNDVKACLERILELGPDQLRDFDRGMIPQIVSNAIGPSSSRAKTVPGHGS